jgi:cell division protein FtsW
VLGGALMGVVMKLDYRLYRQPAFIWSALAVAIVCLVLVLFSPPVNNARRWFSIGGLGIQPSEVAKLSAIFFIAALLERRMERINEFGYALAPIALVVGALIGLILLEPDFGTSMSLAVIAAVMIFAAGLNYTYILGVFLAALPVVAYVAMRASYRRRRLFAFLNPWEDPLGDGFQIIQSLIAVGTGGVTGKGLMNGVQKLFYLPEPHTDFIFAVTAEELGLWGSLLVVTLFGIFLYRGIRTALRTEDMFGKFLATGVTSMVVVQALFNISVVLAMMPAKGIPLPFISYGGSSLFITLASVGVLLNITQQAD